MFTREFTLAVCKYIEKKLKTHFGAFNPKALNFYLQIIVNKNQRNTCQQKQRNTSKQKQRNTCQQKLRNTCQQKQSKYL